MSECHEGHARKGRNANLPIGWDGSASEGNADQEIGVPNSADREIGVPNSADREIGVPNSADREIGVPNSADREIGVPEIVPTGGSSSSPWHRRGYLPHFDGREEIQHVTFHLADSLPKEVFFRLHAEVEHLPEKERKQGLTTRVQDWMDAGCGSCLLREPDIAAMMEGVLLFFDKERYLLFEWVVMPNHVHVLFKPLQGWKVSKIVASWKKFSAREISKRNDNLPIGISPPAVWHREYWDRYMRDEAHFYRVAEYIRDNPVKAGLVERADQWMWGSAFRRADQEIGVPNICSADQEISVPIGVPIGVPYKIGVTIHGFVGTREGTG